VRSATRPENFFSDKAL
jgi:hypothetical protein